MNNRRSFLSKLLTVGVGTALASNVKASPFQLISADPLPSLKGRKILFVYGGWDGHEPEKFRDYLTPWLKEQGAEVILSPNLDPYVDENLMSTIDLFIQIYTIMEITVEQEKGLLTAIKNGAGMAGWHGGMADAFRKNPEYQYMVGGQWVAHPGGVIDYSIKILDTGDAITEGQRDFKITTEQYYMHVDPNVNVLATTQFNGTHDAWIEGCTMPVIWKKMYGKGRIFYTALGHNLQHVLDAKEGMTIIKRGMQWASASKYLPAEKWLSPKY
ncbi:MAG: ThuA domain-containing protein [Cyclobacteriaceae bacterium]|nr:ThuA domain-containing protein [Cyclobacteriaceae bacterium]